jgi:hypothetical protein
MAGNFVLRCVRTRVRWSLIVAAVIGLVLLLPASAFAGNPNEDCPTTLIAKFEVQGSDLVFEEGTEGAITIVDVELDDEGEPTGFEWSSTVEVGSVIVKGGQEVQVFSGDTTTIDFDSPPAISNVQFCGPEDEPSEEPTEPSEAPTEPSEAPTDDEGVDDSGGAAVDDSDVAGDVAGNIPIPTGVAAGAGGDAGPPFAAIVGGLMVLMLAGAAVAGVAARRRG